MAEWQTNRQKDTHTQRERERQTDRQTEGGGQDGGKRGKQDWNRWETEREGEWQRSTKKGENNNQNKMETTKYFILFTFLLY